MKTAILLSTPVDATLRSKVQADTHPQTDYLSLADKLNAALITPITKGFRFLENEPLQF